MASRPGRRPRWSAGAVGKRVEEHWYGKDGWYWYGYRDIGADPDRQGTLEKTKSPGPFELADQPLSLDEIRSLPTDPDRLIEWADGIAHKVSPTWRPQDVRFFVDQLLCQLLAQSPAPPKVRAAAFRALAKRPEVKVGGTVTDPRGAGRP